MRDDAKEKLTIVSGCVCGGEASLIVEGWQSLGGSGHTGARTGPDRTGPLTNSGRFTTADRSAGRIIAYGAAGEACAHY